MGYTNNKPYEACAQLSHACRVYCLKRPRVGLYTLICQSDDESEPFISSLNNGPSVRTKFFWNPTVAINATFFGVYVHLDDGDKLVPLSLAGNSSFLFCYFASEDEDGFEAEMVSFDVMNANDGIIIERCRYEKNRDSKDGRDSEDNQDSEDDYGEKIMGNSKRKAYSF